ncbi:MAG: hypothetical protein ACRDGO_04875 [Actinomycetota bacterium]
MSEADDVFAEQVARWRATSWRDLQKDLDDAVAYEIAGSDGARYQFEVLVPWDDPRERTDLRILFTGDDGRGWRMTGMRHTDFVKAPDDSFVGEDDV